MPGSRIHHSVGTWPLLVSDETVVEACEPEQLIRLRAKGKAMGQAIVEISLHDEGDRTRVVMVHRPETQLLDESANGSAGEHLRLRVRFRE